VFEKSASILMVDASETARRQRTILIHHRSRSGRILMQHKRYDTDLTDAAWELVAPLGPSARYGGRPRTTDIRAVVNAIFYLLRTGCQWRLLPREFPAWGTVYYYFRNWENLGVWTNLQNTIYAKTRLAAGRAPCLSVVIMDSQSVKTT
jgi:putative transposase